MAKYSVLITSLYQCMGIRKTICYCHKIIMCFSMHKTLCIACTQIILGLYIEPCSHVIVWAAAARRSILSATARRERRSSLFSHTFFKHLSAKNFCYQGIGVEQLLFWRLSGF